MEEIILMCKKCKRLPQLDKKESNKNWGVIKQKKCPVCGTKYDYEVISREELVKMEKEREEFGKYV